MTRRFEYEIFAECQQFFLQDERAEEYPDWTGEEVYRLLAVQPRIMSVGTTSDTFVTVVVEINDSEPDEDMSVWDQVNESTLEITSGRLVIACVGDGPLDARRIEVLSGSYRARIYYGNLSLLTDDHYRVVLWRAPPGPLLVLKQRRQIHACHWV